MAGSPLANLKNGAKAFIDIIEEASNSSENGQIGSGSHIGIVSFSGVATKDTQLITSAADLKAAIDALSVDRFTNHEDAFIKALELFDPDSTNEKIMIMFTDGETTAGGPPNTEATLAKSRGVVIYCIGLSGNNGIDEQSLFDWASDPDSAHVTITPNDEELEKLFKDLAENITKPGATNIVITDTVTPCFRITALSSPTKGTARMVDANTVEWKIDKLGDKKGEGAVFEFTVEHVGPCSGTVEVNESITYHDKEKNKISFPNPTIEVDCSTVICPEGEPVVADILIDGCDDSVEFDAGKICLEGLGRIVQLDVNLHNVCPNKRVALAVLLYETDAEGCEHKRGMKTMTVPAHTKQNCHDVVVRCIKFVLPEDLDVTSIPTSICNDRHFKEKFIAHYIDNDYKCCCCDDQS